VRAANALFKENALRGDMKKPHEKNSDIKRGAHNFRKIFCCELGGREKGQRGPKSPVGHAVIKARGCCI